MAHRKREPLDIALVVVKGEAEPAEPYPLDRERAVTIGRTGSIRLLDQLVSIHHARVIFDPNKEQFLIEDLGSATGTFVDGECVRGERRELKVGTELRLGETTLKVERVARLAWVLPVVGLSAGLLVLTALVLVVGYYFKTPAANEPLHWDPGVLTPAGRKTELVVPDAFRWERGLSLPLQIKHVSDYDSSGRDEIWVVDGKRKHEVVVTFDEKGEWVDLGMLPFDCIRREDDQSFPLVDCKGEQWRMDPTVNRYRPVFHEGPVVWFRPVKARPEPLTADERKEKKKKDDAEKKKKLDAEKKRKKEGLPPEPEPEAVVPPPPAPTVRLEEAPLEVGRFALKDKYQLAQFLSERGIYEPVHYIICEGAFHGIRAQVLTYSGVVQELGVGCIEELKIEGQVSGRPYAAAFTPAGLRALTGDVMAFYAGNPDGLFLDDEWKAVGTALSADPGHYRGAVRLMATTKNASLQAFDPLPPLDTVIEGTHRLVETDRMLVPAAPATTTVLATPGVPQKISTSGCEVFEIETSSYGPTSWFSSETLLTVREVGCGASKTVMTVGYETGRTRAKVGDREIAVDVELEKALIGGVVRVRFSWR